MYKSPTAQTADVLLISEGAYPFVAGGVSTWVQTLITNMPTTTFAIVFLGAKQSDYQGLKYQLPSNVVDFRSHYLFDDKLSPKKRNVAMASDTYQGMEALHEWFKAPHDSEKQQVVSNLIDLFDRDKGITEAQFLYSESAWEFINECYDSYSTEPSFIDYFWTIRNLHSPLWGLAKLVRQLPQAKLIHSVSTGYAGFLSGLIKSHQKIPLVLTEHGIYTKERRIELLQSKIVKAQNPLTRTDDIDYLRELWIRFFSALANVCYTMSDNVIALYHGASERQRADGAAPEKQHVIPNGIDINALKKYRNRPSAREKKRICLLGRVVPIKDIKTCILAAKQLEQEQAEVWIVGPEDEDKAYVDECKNLVKSLQLSETVFFKGKMSLDDILPQIDLMLLSSISEGMPLVMLEAFAAGIPVVSTNVGACAELIEGIGSDDKAIGAAGRIAKIAAAQDVAASLRAMLDEKNWQRASKAAIKRVEAYYSVEKMIATYSALYQRVGT